jgi:nitrogen fixation NifU-like protein
LYSPRVLDHFRNPRNVGEIKNADGVATITSPDSTDVFTIYVKIRENRIVDIKFKTFGCVAAIASSSILTELSQGKTIQEALTITRKDIADSLGGLPPTKMECSTLAADALHEAIKNYRKKRKKEDKIR